MNRLRKVNISINFKYRLTKDYPWQVSYIPVKIDNTAPKIVSVDFSNPEKIKLITKDTYHKVKDQYKNETLFARDQKEHPEKFDEIANEVGMPAPLWLMKMEKLRKILK